MFMIELTYKAPITEVDKYLQAHREFLDYHYKQGLLVLSGPKKPRVGGVILAATTDKAYLESVFKQDPYYLADIADYEFTEFTPVKYCEQLTELVTRTEGQL